MNSSTAAVLAAVEGVTKELRSLLELLAAHQAPDASQAVPAVEAVGRLVDAARVHAAAPLARDRAQAERLGFASPVAAVATLAQISERSARARLAVAEAVIPDSSVSGAVLEPRHPAVARALATGRLGLEGAVLITRELEKSAPRVPAEVRAVAESAMVDLACELVSVDHLTSQIRTIGAAIDPDGARPREERTLLKRDAWLGREDDDGLFPLVCRLTPDLAIPLLRAFEAARRSPRFVDPVDDAADAHDSRTPGQRRHDILGEILMTAIAAEGSPLLNGRTAAVLVTVSAEQLSRTAGLDSDPIVTMSGSQFPVSRKRVEQFIDAGGYRVVTLTPTGAIVGIGSRERCFTSMQTLAIAARDGERCFTPGCTSPHTALQVHHVVPWREGGATNTNNGLLLCYWHHQRVDDGPWHYRMANGAPEVRGPGVPEWARPTALLARAA